MSRQILIRFAKIILNFVLCECSVVFQLLKVMLVLSCVEIVRNTFPKIRQQLSCTIRQSNYGTLSGFVFACFKKDLKKCSKASYLLQSQLDYLPLYVLNIYHFMFYFYLLHVELMPPH
jgi:hypothetical protein